MVAGICPVALGTYLTPLMTTTLGLIFAVGVLAAGGAGMAGPAVLVVLLAPKTGPVVLVLAAVMGVSFLSTVPPTAGLVAQFFGVRHMATLFGLVLLTHPLGGFLDAWLGGQVFQATGRCDIVWMPDIGLAVAATLIHLPIEEAPMVRQAAAAV